MIPQEKSEAVSRGLREAFRVTAFDDIAKVTGGHTTSLVFRIIVRGSPYLLKIILRTDDAARNFASMKAAADAGVAPRVWYASVEDKVSITDFVQAVPLPRSEALVHLPPLLRTLHSLPSFGRAPFNTSCTFLVDKGPALDAFLGKFQAAGILPKSAAAEFFARHAELAAAFPPGGGELVSSHNDLFKPDNILFDGQRVWLADWETAFLNDRYADLAVVANQLVTSDEEESAYLRGYFGEPPDPYQRARFYLMRQLAHLFYTMAFLYLGSSGKPVDWSAPVPDYYDYCRRLWAGELDLADSAVKIVYGRVHWERLLHNLRQPRYTQDLRTVSNRHAA